MTQRTGRGFTMVELLVVIAIMVVLAGILFPVVGAMRDKAKAEAWRAKTAERAKDASLVAYYTFEEGDGLIVPNKAIEGSDEPREYQAKFEGDPTWSSGRWKSKGAIKLDGTNDYLKVENCILNVAESALTVEVWFKRDGTSDEKIVQQLDDTGTGRTWVGYDGTNQPFTELGGTPTTVSQEVKNEEWVQVCVTKDGTDGATEPVNIYYNGGETSQLSTQSFATGENSKGNFVFGADKPSMTNKMKGSIDEIAIYDRALSADEVAELYKQGKP